MESRRMNSAEEHELGDHGVQRLMDDTSSEGVHSTGDELSDGEHAIDYSAIDNCQRQRGSTTRPPPSNNHLLQHRGGSIRSSAATIAHGSQRSVLRNVPTFTNPDGMGSRNISCRRSSRLRAQHAQLQQSSSPHAESSDPAHVDNMFDDNIVIQCTADTTNRHKGKKAKTNSQWTDETMKTALAAVDNGTSMRAASTASGIPYSTLREWCYGVRTSRKRGPPSILSAAEEQEIVDYLIAMSELGYGLTSTAFKMKVYEITKARWTPFENGVPGRGWMRCWKCRHPELTVRVAEGLEAARARGFTVDTANSFYDNLEVLYKTYSYSAEQIWNCDETGTQAGRNGGAHVIARRGARNVHSVIPDKREWMSILVCVNAAGAAIPSFYIFRGKRFRQNYVKRCEPGAAMAMQQKAWMTGFLFSTWLSHFIQNVQKLGGISAERRHLLILDGHSSHVSLEVICHAKAAGLDLVTLPSHTSHALQPLDCSVFKPFKDYFRSYRDYWSRHNIGMTPSKQTLAQWVSLALRRALSEKNIKAGFRGTGILPLDREATKRHMMPASAYGQPCNSNDKTTVLEGQTTESVHYEAENGQDDNDEASVVEDGSEQQCLQSDEIEKNLAEEHGPTVQHFFVAVNPTDPDVPDEMVSFDADIAVADSMTTFLTLPSITPRVNHKPQDPAVDFTKSIMLTSDEYIAAVQEFHKAKVDTAQEKQRLREEKEERKKRKAADKEEERVEKEARAQQVAQARAMKTQEREEVRAKRQEASAQRAAEKASKAAQRAQSQRRKVLQAAESSGWPQEQDVQAEGQQNEVRETSRVNMPFPPFSTSPNQLQPNDQFVTSIYSTLPSVPHPAFNYMIPGSHFSPAMYPEALRPQPWTMQPPSSTTSTGQGAVRNYTQPGIARNGRGVAQHDGHHVPTGTFPGWPTTSQYS